MSDSDSPPRSAVVITWGEGYEKPARQFAEEHKLPIINETPGQGGLRFRLDAGGWSLLEAEKDTTQAYAPSFQARYEARGRDPLLKAMGRASRVLDLTAGWGEDALHIARSGRSVTGVERNPVVHRLLLQARQRMADAVLASRIEFLCLDAASPEFHALLARKLGEEPAFDLVYIDPMFADRQGKRALAKKPMRLLQQLTETPEPENEAALLRNALALARLRVVVKRSLRLPPISEHRLQGSVQSKLLRFDLYQP